MRPVKGCGKDMWYGYKIYLSSAIWSMRDHNETRNAYENRYTDKNDPPD